jgi:hypothetical protein
VFELTRDPSTLLLPVPIALVALSWKPLAELEDRLPDIDVRRNRANTGIELWFPSDTPWSAASCPAAEAQKAALPRAAIAQKRKEVLMIIYSLS